MELWQWSIHEKLGRDRYVFFLYKHNMRQNAGDRSPTIIQQEVLLDRVTCFRGIEKCDQRGWMGANQNLQISAWTGLTGATIRSDRSCRPDRSDRYRRSVWPVAPRKPRKSTSKRWILSKRCPNSTKLGGYLHNCPVNISPRDLSQKIKGTWEFEGRSKWIGVFSRTWKTPIRENSRFQGVWH